jgi:diadenylate cyclase
VNPLLLKDFFAMHKLASMVDIILVSLLIYQVYRLARSNASVKIIIGFGLLYLVYRLATIAQLVWLPTLLGQVFYKGALVIVVIFQYELRKFLALLGDFIPTTIRRILTNLPWAKPNNLSVYVTCIVEAAKALGGSNTGGLIVLTNTPNLKFYMESGDVINALVSKRLLLAILNKASPLHDGAVLIYKNTILAARVILPVTEKQDLPVQYALRHRAAIGMSEATDTLVLVISEDTGQLSIAYKGKLSPNLSASELRTAINTYLGNII